VRVPHLTLAFTGCAPDHLAELEFAERLERGDVAVDLTVTGFAFDERCLCALCPAPPNPAGRNRHGHITIATAPGTATAYANSLLRRLLDSEGGEGERSGVGGDRSGGATRVLLDEPLVLKSQQLRRFFPGE